MNATYSPEDNKLRLYPDSRLPKELYERVRAAGFIWAPKQELFVAPSWTPEREDLLQELCGEIGDEDTSLVDRAEQRAERFDEYSESRREDADRAHDGVKAIADNIPLGQPILVGHHSEKHARKDAERIENGMRRAVKMWETAKYWEQRAKGAVRSAKYKERPDVRARRIKGIEADKRKQERNKLEVEVEMRFWNGEMKLRNKETGEVRPFEIIEANRERIERHLGRSSGGYLPCAKQEDGIGYWHAWDVLRPDEERYKACPSMTVEAVKAVALEHYPKVMARYNRWIAHYENRLAYERAMLAEDGGTASDKVKPEIGGACKSWVSRGGGWSTIVKVNKVSVSVLDNWGNQGENFRRNVSFDKLSGLMSAAQVQALKDADRFVPTQDGTGFFVRDEVAERPAVEPYVKPEPTAFDAMKETLKAGVQVVSAPQLFPTPLELAERMVSMADIQEGQRLLEPSAGLGSLVREMIRRPNGKNPPMWLDVRLVAVEISNDLCMALRAAYPSQDIHCKDFLTCNGDLGTFDRILMNPPFVNGADIQHILHARTFLNPGGRLVAICANGPRQRETLQPLAETWIDLEPETFKESGTNVNAALLVITEQEAA